MKTAPFLQNPLPAVALCLWLAAGCNAHAVFPEDREPVCGDGLIGEGEPCDHHSRTGEDAFPSGTTCVNLGFGGGGLLKCSAECQLDTSNCDHGGGCEPLTNQGCDQDACLFFPYDGLGAFCTDPGAGDVGARCVSTHECQFGLTCFEGLCQPLCGSDFPCEGGLPCQTWPGWQDGALGFCYARGCDVVTGLGCEGNWVACYLDELSFEAGCRDRTTDLGTGVGCMQSGECAPGHLCRELEGAKVCTRLCDDFHGCEVGFCAFATGYTPGQCVTHTACVPLNGDPPCFEPLVCTVLDDDGHTACLQPGWLGNNEICDLFNRCRPDYFCDSLGDGRRACRPLCRIAADCPTGTCVTETYPAFPDGLGVCK